MDKSPKRLFLVVFSSEEEEIADVNSLQKEFEEIANKTSTDSENIVNFDDKVVFGLKETPLKRLRAKMTCQM
ncbi:unnamed protein product [Rhizophagus irregularis]|nr:unnamed protein product [Rhizophagus irregularis]